MTFLFREPSKELGKSSFPLTDGALARWEASQELEVPFFQQMAPTE
jgi:hypothetical protein